MAATEAYTANLTVGTTEESVTGGSPSGGPQSVTTAGIYTATFDLNALGAGDSFQFRAYEKCRSGDTQRVIFEKVIANPLPGLLSFPPVMLLNGWDFTIKKLAGTDRAIPSSIRKGATVSEAYTMSGTIGVGDQSLTGGSPGGIQAQTAAGFYQIFLDVNALTYGDEFMLKRYEKARTADTQRLHTIHSLHGPWSPPIFVSPILELMNGWDATIQRLAGADRSIAASIRKVA